MTGAIIQARMGSSRCPEKTLRLLYGKPLLAHVIDRTRQARGVETIIVATTVNREDDAIEGYCKENGIPVFRGSSDDVLDRYYQAAKQYNIDTVVRVTADDPFKDPAVIDLAIDTFKTHDYDYVSNTIEPTYPEGIDVEVFSFESLATAWKDAKLPSEREHVTPYIWKNGDLFKVYNFRNTVDQSHYRLTVDHDEDFVFAEKLLSLLPQNGFSFGDIVRTIDENPEIKTLNGSFVRNEGYLLSVKKETKEGKQS